MSEPIKDTLRFDCTGMFANQLGEFVKTIGQLRCPNHGEAPEYKPARGMTTDDRTKAYRGECLVDITCCCPALRDLARARVSKWK